MRGLYRGVYSVLFDHPDYQALTSSARLLLVTARQCSQAGPAAIFRYYPEILARQTGLTIRRVGVALSELCVKPHPEQAWVVADRVVLWVRNGLRHDPSMRLADRKHRLSVERAIAGLPRSEIVIRFCDYYEIARPFDAPSKGYLDLALREGEGEGVGVGEGEESNYIVGPSPTPRSQAIEILEFLNQKAHKTFRTTDTNLNLIVARLRSGASPQDCKSLIAMKVRQWAPDPKMAMYLRPATLFNATKFEQYLGEMNGHDAQ